MNELNKGVLNKEQPFDDDIEGMFADLPDANPQKVYNHEDVDKELKNTSNIHKGKSNNQKAYEEIMDKFSKEFGTRLDLPEDEEEKLHFEESLNKADTTKEMEEERRRAESIKNFHNEMNKTILNPVADEEENYKSIIDKFDILDSQQFKGIFSSFEKDGKDLNVYLKTGSYIKMNESKLSLMHSDKRVEKLPDIKSEVTALIMLSHEKGLRNFKINGNAEYVEEAMKQISQLNKKLGKDGFKVSCDPQFKHLYDRHFKVEEPVKKEKTLKDEVISFTSDEEVKKDKKAQP